MSDLDEMERTHRLHRTIGAPDLAQSHAWIELLAASRPSANESGAITAMRKEYLRTVKFNTRWPLTRAKRRGIKGLVAALRQVA